MSQNNYGAHTGEIAAGMLKEFSTKYVILGHSERREYQRESNELIAAKSKTAHEAGLKPIVCVGEQLDEREAGKTEDVVNTQVRGSLEGLTEEGKKLVIDLEVKRAGLARDTSKRRLTKQLTGKEAMGPLSNIGAQPGAGAQGHGARRR